MKSDYQSSAKRGMRLYAISLTLLAFIILGGMPGIAEAGSYGDHGNYGGDHHGDYGDHHDDEDDSEETSPLDCPFESEEGRTIVNFDTSRKLVSTTGEYPETPRESVELSAGNYAISLYSYDAYPDRVNVSQPHEQWRVIFRYGDAEVGISSAIGDLSDNVAVSTRTETVDDSLTLHDVADSVTAYHAFYPDDSDPNSVTPICAAFDFLVEDGGEEETNTPPTITLNGSASIELIVGSTFTDPGATATDIEDGDLTGEIVVSGEVATSTVGVYTLTYSVSDSDGAGATTTRTVTVKEDDDNNGGGGEEEPTATGSIRFCKMITTLGGEVATTSAGIPTGTFTIPLSFTASSTASTTTESPVVFSTSGFALNASLIATSTSDANCITRTNLPVGTYTYGEEVISGSGWNTPLYNDQNTGAVTGLSNFFTYSATSSNSNADGSIVLTASSTETLIILNRATATSTDDGQGGGDGNGTGGGEDSNNGNGGGSSNRGGGGGGSISLRVTNEEVKEVVTGIALVEWDTNRSATSQVVYGTHSVSDSDIDENDEDNNFGYESTTNELTETLTHHGVAVGGLQADTTYYFRPVSRRGNEIELGEEVMIRPEFASDSCVYMYDYLKRGWNNNPVEVKKLQIFLHNLEGHTNLEITGIFDDATFAAVSAFQEKYKADILTPWGHEQATGFDYILTTKKINEIFCGKAFPLTPAQQQEITDFRAFLQSLKDEGITDGSTSIPPREGELPPYDGNTTPGDGTNGGVIIDEGEIGMGTGTGSSTPLERGVLGNLAAAIFSMPETAAETTRCIFNFIIILAIIYIITSILVSNEETLARDKHRMRRLMFFIGGIIIALAFALFFDMYCLVVPLGVTFLILLVLVIWNNMKGNKTPGSTVGKGGSTGGGVPPKPTPVIVEQAKPATVGGAPTPEVK